jgi:CRISPR-associated endonuclease/helicase Cas3
VCGEDAAYDLLEAHVAAHQPEHARVSLVHSHSYDNTAYNDHRLAAHEPSTSDAYWPDSDDGDRSGGEPAAGERPEERVTVPDGWLRGWDRALLAQFTAATHDQALMAALPVRFSALRLLALSGRTVIVDEVHALPPFMRQTLFRLLHWLGALGCPVVLLSATLPGHISEQLVRSYLDGAGHPHPVTAHLDCRPPYPGWLYAAASDASLTRIASAAAAAHADRHRRRADIRLHPVRHPSCTDPEDAPARESRLERITQEVAPVARLRGCAAVYCATVADAQATYAHLYRPGLVGRWSRRSAAPAPCPPARPPTRGPHPPRPHRLVVGRRASRAAGGRYHQPAGHEPRRRRRRHGQ